MHHDETHNLFDPAGREGPPPWSEAESAFERARVLYRTECNPAGIRGHDTEWRDFQKRHRDWRTAALQIAKCIRVIQRNREVEKARVGWVSHWPMWSTFQHQRRWEEGLQPQVDPRKANRPAVSVPKPPEPDYGPALSVEEKIRIRKEYEARTGRTVAMPAKGEEAPAAEL